MTQAVENRLHFGVPIFETLLDSVLENQQALAEHVLALRGQDKDKMQRSNHGGWHSADNLQLSESPVIKKIMAAIVEIGVACIKHVEEPEYQGEVELTSAWANVNESGDWNAPHMHLPCEWSGVVYIQAQAEPAKRGDCYDGDILFFDPQPLGTQYRRPPFHPYSPKVGTMFIFPSYLLHMVAPHFDTQPRISIAFNFRLSEYLRSIGV